MAGVAGSLVFPVLKASDCVPQALTAGMPLAPGPSTSEGRTYGDLGSCPGTAAGQGQLRPARARSFPTQGVFQGGQCQLVERGHDLGQDPTMGDHFRAGRLSSDRGAQEVGRGLPGPA